MTQAPKQNDMIALMDALGHDRFAVFGTDVGMPIAYALAADHPGRIDRLIVSEAVVPGVSPPLPLLLPSKTNDRLFHFGFNRLGQLNEQLVRGREDIFFGYELAITAGTPLPGDVVKYYVDGIASDPEALRGSFEFYRAFDTTIAQNEQRKTQRLTLPVLALGGALGIGEGAANTMKLVANDVQTVVIPGSGHWIAEEAPDDVVTALTAFLAP